MKNFKFQISNFKSSKGFSLLEVIVALAIIGIGLMLVMELFSGALRSGRLSKDYTEAFIYARGKMDEVLIDPKEGSATGEFNNNYRWHSEVTLLNDKTHDKGLKTQESGWQTYKIKVNVFFPGLGGEKTIELVTIKSVPLGGLK